MNEALHRTKVLWIQERYLAEILTGRKTIEVRVAYSNIARLQPGDILRLNDRASYVIQRIARYAGFADLAQAEPPDRIAPGSSAAELLTALRELYPPDKEALGAIALELAPLRS